MECRGRWKLALSKKSCFLSSHVQPPQMFPAHDTGTCSELQSVLHIFVGGDLKHGKNDQGHKLTVTSLGEVSRKYIT